MVSLVDYDIANSACDAVFQNADSVWLCPFKGKSLAIPHVSSSANDRELKFLVVVFTFEVDLEAGEAVKLLRVLKCGNRCELHSWLVHSHKCRQIGKQVGVLVSWSVHVRDIEALAWQLGQGACTQSGRGN